MSDLDPRLRERFTAYRNDVVTKVAGPGPDQARHLLRRRRRMTAVAVAAAAVVLVVAPVVANAALRGDQNRPMPAESVQPTAPSTSTPPTPPPTGSPTPTPSANAPAAPDGRISRAQLLATRVDLPSWQPGEMEGGCTTSKVRLQTDTKKVYVPELTDDEFEHGDVDGDGAVETIAIVACRYGEASAKQVVTFDRARDGRIVTVGRVVRTGDGFEDIRSVEITAAGSVEVRVADIVPCCGTPEYLRREQVRTYRWNGQRFSQTDGPTTFGGDPRLTDLRMTMTHKLVDVPGADTRRELTTVFTVTNAGPVDAAQVAFHSIEGGERTGGDWSRCDRDPASQANQPSCLLPGVPVGESRRYTFVQLVPGRPGPDAITRRFLVVHCDAQDRWWPDLKRTDNEVRSPLPL
ncbi:hypothetical protein GAR05_03492 [Micromonospora saelicesensis]|uniref:Uncharacterized protein n=1 Tax=Micromonospora saelicesensis TaxID=285676 RepID=A0ABX9CHG8_9ACTN|nr:hypothetical protein [Micromonospora saelicesensis]RAN97966.1 hypothetical protein GAR05_03492 [Micromonospora saelicesensis]